MPADRVFDKPAHNGVEPGDGSLFSVLLDFDLLFQSGFDGAGETAAALRSSSRIALGALLPGMLLGRPAASDFVVRHGGLASAVLKFLYFCAMTKSKKMQDFFISVVA